MTGAISRNGTTSAMQNLVLIIAFYLPCACRPAFLYHCHAGGTDCCPEDGPRPPAQSQRQSRGACHTKHIRNEYIPTFVGPEVTRTQRANEVDYLGQTFQCDCSDQSHICSHESQDEVHLQDCHRVPQEIEHQTRIECDRLF